MRADLTLLLPLAVLWPMLLAGLALLPGWGPRMVMLLLLGPLPALFSLGGLSARTRLAMPVPPPGSILPHFQPVCQEVSKSQPHSESQ